MEIAFRRVRFDFDPIRTCPLVTSLTTIRILRSIGCDFLARRHEAGLNKFGGTIDMILKKVTILPLNPSVRDRDEKGGTARDEGTRDGNGKNDFEQRKARWIGSSFACGLQMASIEIQFAIIHSGGSLRGYDPAEFYVRSWHG